MQLTLKILRKEIPLKNPYALSFVTLDKFVTYYVIIFGDNKFGIGEITPLYGYSPETDKSVENELLYTINSLKKNVSLGDVIIDIHSRAPFTASGIATALDIWKEYGIEFITQPTENNVPLAGMCQGDTIEKLCQSAKLLTGNGYKTIKLKIGSKPLNEDINGIIAITSNIPASTELRLDANQSLDLETSVQLCHAISDVPSVLLEQPLPKDDWDNYVRLKDLTSIPIMLDESIWDISDIQRAYQCGINIIKLKLCKSRGITACLESIKIARDFGMDVIIGNGVQTVLGNHFEAKIHSMAKLDTAAECNGLLKAIKSPINHNITVDNGILVDKGIGDLQYMIDENSIFETTFTYIP